MRLDYAACLLMALAATSKAEDLSEPNETTAETDPQDVISIDAISNDDSLLEVDFVVEESYEDAPTETPDFGGVEIYQHSQLRSRELGSWEDEIKVEVKDFSDGYAKVSWPCVNKWLARKDWICWKNKGSKGSPCDSNEIVHKTDGSSGITGAPKCSHETTDLKCNTQYTLRIKKTSFNYNDKDFTTGKCRCEDDRPCKLFWPNVFFNHVTQRCEVVAPNVTKNNGVWYFEKIPNPGNDPFYCPKINGVQTTVENEFDCLIATAPAGRYAAVFDRAFYYAAVFDPANPSANLCPYRPFSSSGPRTLVTDGGFPFIACFVADIPTSYEHIYVDGQKLLTKHENICRSPLLCLTNKYKYLISGVYDHTKDYCFVMNESQTNALIKGNLNGDVEYDYGCASCSGHKFTYASCVDFTSNRRRLANADEIDRLVVQDFAEKIVERECGAPPVCPSADPNIGTCSPCSSRGAAQRLADMIYDSLPTDDIKRQVESGSLKLQSQGFGSSEDADKGLAKNVATGDFSGAVATLSFLLSRWYPVDGTCKRDGNHPPYMESNGWLNESLDSCCAQHFQWAFDACVGGGELLEPTNKYFADYQSGTCLKDCEPGASIFGCAQVPPPIALYDTVETCCSVGQSWVDLAYCTSRSIGELSDGWVVDYPHKKCVKDCDPADGPPCADSMHQDISTTIFATPEECCQGKLNWIDLDSCVADSQHILLHTDEFYVDWNNGFKCAKDCDPAAGLPCMGNPTASSLRLFGTAKSCCEGSLGWIGVDQCIANTNGVALQTQGSEEWYVDWLNNDGKCVKNCVGGPPCGGLKKKWNTGHASATACCDTIYWVPSNRCHL